MKALLSDLTEQVLAGELETGPAALANQLINTRPRVVEVERKLRESEDYEARIETLEASLGDRKEGRRWRA